MRKGFLRSSKIGLESRGVLLPWRLWKFCDRASLSASINLCGSPRYNPGSPEKGQEDPASESMNKKRKRLKRQEINKNDVTLVCMIDDQIGWYFRSP